jgi:hypothetical protein
LRGILNTGHRRGGQVLRTVGEDHEPRQFSTWAPAAIAMIGRLPDTLNDLSVVINLRRRKPTEKVKSFRRDRAGDLDGLARKMARWAHDHTVALTAADPDMGELVNRVADNWRPLFAIADIAGGSWPKRVREIAITANKASSEQSVSTLLLQDIHWIFEGRPETDDGGGTVLRGIKSDRASSADLVSQLVAIEGHPWAEWKGGQRDHPKRPRPDAGQVRHQTGNHPPSHRADGQGLLPLGLRRRLLVLPTLSNRHNATTQ